MRSGSLVPLRGFRSLDPPLDGISQIAKVRAVLRLLVVPYGIFFREIGENKIVDLESVEIVIERHDCTAVSAPKENAISKTVCRAHTAWRRLVAGHSHFLPSRQYRQPLLKLRKKGL